eukprot:m.170245 g.170245  ORF g.170245 m.170245 type:complete len:113 (+) comp18261_c0_seq3:90-428(+)
MQIIVTFPLYIPLMELLQQFGCGQYTCTFADGRDRVTEGLICSIPLQATSLVTATVNDPEVQQSTGQGAWRAFMYGFTPQYIRPDYWRQPPSPPIVADVLIEDEGEDTSGTT